MASNGQETEAKFYVRDLEKIALRLQDLGAHLIQTRVLEMNIRFDLPGARLRSEGRVLRLRRDTEARLTYKGASTNNQGVLSRTEIEFTVEDFDKAKGFLEALGYQRMIYYEKYRTTYALQPPEGIIRIMLDELPYGNFVEIEGEAIESIQRVSEALNFDWDAAIATSYHTLFDRARKSLDLPFHDLSFENFTGIQVVPEDLGVRAAEKITRSAITHENTKMTPMTVDAEDLIMALEYQGYDARYIFDRETGEVIFMPDVAIVGDDVMDEELSEAVEEGWGTRYIAVDPVPSWEGWNVMRDFIETINDEKIANRLYRAIEGRSPFRRFKDELLNYPELREAWFRFHDEAFIQLAKDWLRDHQIEATLKVRKQTGTTGR